MPVNTPRAEYDGYASKWRRCRDCHEGSDAVKDANTLYLPPLASHTKGESNQKYLAYKMRALFFNAMGRTVAGLAGAIFQRPPEIKGPKALAEQLADVTQSGIGIEGFGMESATEILITGRVGIMIEMPAEASAESRPYWVLYQAEDIISWSTDRVFGDEILTRVVLREKEETTSDKDEFLFKLVDQCRVLELVDGVYTVSVWRQKEESKDWIRVDQTEPKRRGKPLDFIPFCFITPTSLSARLEKPPLLDLAEVNLSHYRTSADLEHGRHFTALPTPWVSGVDKKTKLEIGSGVAWILDKDGEAGMLEFTGQGLKALETAEEQKRKMMATLGARLLEDQPVTPETATAVGMRHAGEQATLKSIVGNLEQGLSIVARWHAWWTGTVADPREQDVEIGLNKDFYPRRMTPQELQALVMALQAETISHETFWANLQRGEIARVGTTSEDELRKIAEEGEMLDKPDGDDEKTQPVPPDRDEERESVVAGNPWRIERRGATFVVVKSDTGEIVGQHDTEEAAKAQLAALHANVKEGE